MSFEAQERSVDKLLNDAIYCIPRNQRRYVWNERNWAELLKTIEENDDVKVLQEVQIKKLIEAYKTAIKLRKA